VESADVTRERILSAAVAQIERSGEGAVRLRDVAAVAGITEPTIYYHFANRQALVEAAHAYRFRTNLRGTLDPFLEAMRGCQSREHFEQIIAFLYELSFAAGREVVRATRAEIIGHSARRPGLRAEITSAMEQALGPAVELLENAQRRGWLRPDVDARAFVYWNLANITGLTFVELPGDDALLDGFRALMRESATALLKGWPDEAIAAADRR
jgi:AcrR family transcriptional regulator